MGNLIVSLSPHAHGNDSVKKNMCWVIGALIPALLASFYFFGLGSVIVCATSVIACVFFEWAISKFILKQEGCTVCDGSAALTGVLLGMNLPSTLPIWMIIIGALIAIGVGKMTFGGLGQNPFNPALVGRCFLLVSFPTAMTTWTAPAGVDAFTGATPLALMKQAIKGNPDALKELPSTLDMFLGCNAGSMGEVCALLLLLGAAVLIWKKVITWHIPVSIIGTVFVLSALLWACDAQTYANPFQVIFAGGLMLGACFMATDYVTSPMCAKGQIIYGISIGVLTLVIRNWGAYPEGMSFAILIMNAFTPLINMYTKPKRFGEVPATK